MLQVCGGDLRASGPGMLLSALANVARTCMLPWQPQWAAAAAAL